MGAAFGSSSLETVVNRTSTTSPSRKPICVSLSENSEM
jgi:hypothetical protein